MSSDILPVGKLPPELLLKIFSQNPIHDNQVILGPGIGLDCAVINTGGPNLLVVKSEPVTFATDQIGWYALQVAANDIATAGALPRWYSATLLLPENKTDEALVLQISEQVAAACQALHISLIGGHTEITAGLDRPLLIGSMIGEVPSNQLVTPQGARPGHKILLTKGVPIEATALLAREFPQKIIPFLGEDTVRQAAGYLHSPGISIIRDARLAMRAGRVTAMHDPTEGGLASALWELALASKNNLVIDPAAVHIPSLCQKICAVFELDPLATLASGALLLTTPSEDAPAIQRAVKAAGIPCNVIGYVTEGPGQVWCENRGQTTLLPRPARDEITRVYERPVT